VFALKKTSIFQVQQQETTYGADHQQLPLEKPATASNDNNNDLVNIVACSLPKKMDLSAAVTRNNVSCQLPMATSRKTCYLPPTTHCLRKCGSFNSDKKKQRTAPSTIICYPSNDNKKQCIVPTEICANRRLLLPLKKPASSDNMGYLSSPET